MQRGENLLSSQQKPFTKLFDPTNNQDVQIKTTARRSRIPRWAKLTAPDNTMSW